MTEAGFNILEAMESCIPQTIQLKSHSCLMLVYIISAFDQLILTACFGHIVSSISSLFLLVVSAEEHYSASDATAIE